MKTVLVTGACGLLGQHLVNRLKSKYKVAAVDIASNVFENHPGIKFIECDLTESGKLLEIVSDVSPDIVYNCAAYTDVDGCEKNRDMAYRLNVKLVENLIDADVERLVHYSSDYVFNGLQGPYDEEDETDPIGYYGKTKLLSENIILDSDGGHLVIRTNVLFGTGINIRPNFIAWLVESLKQGKQLKIVTDQYNNPIHATNLAEASIEAEEKGLTGILHIAGGSYLSRYEMAIKTADCFILDKNLILPVTTSELGQTARRPMRGGLRIEKAMKLLDSRLLSFDEALELLKI